MRSKKAFYNIVTNFVLKIVIIIYGFIIPKIILNHFGSSVNGLVSSITQFLGYITLLESGFGPVLKATLYKPIANKDQKKIESILRSSEKIFKRIAKIFVIYIFLLIIIYPILINNQFSYIFTSSLIFIISISTFAEYYFGMTYRIYLQSEQKMYVVSIIQILTYLLNIFVILILVCVNSSIHVIKLISGLIFVLRPIIQNLYVKKKYNLNLDNNKEEYKIEQKWDGLAQHIAFVIHSNTDITILTIFSKLTEVSVYSVYSLVINGVKSLVQVFTDGMDASFGDIIAKDEKQNLNSKFEIYELVCHSVNTICFSSAAILIVPFVSLYTSNISDANYIRNLFGLLLVISELVWATRLPYNTLISASGHFKETKKGAWVECFSNILISVILVRKYGIVGVVIGTLVAMTIRTSEFIYHSNKYILCRKLNYSIKKIFLIILEFLLIVTFSKYIPYMTNTNFVNWIINAMIVFIFSSIVTLGLNFIFFKNEFKRIFYRIKKMIFKKKKGNL